MQKINDSNSIHLLDFPTYNLDLVDTTLSDDMSKVQKIIQLGLSRRSRNKIRVRQPLSTITIGFVLPDYLQEVITDELNIKQIIFDPEINQKVQKIIKPDGKILGKKFGADFKTVLESAKSGKFEEKDGKILVGKFTMEPGEYEIDYIKTDPTLDVEIGDGMVVAIDPTLTTELEQEGLARDLVRIIQDARKEANFDIADRIQISITGDNIGFIKNFSDYITQETLSSLVDKIPSPNLTKEIEVGDCQISIGLKK